MQAADALVLSIHSHTQCAQNSLLPNCTLRTGAFE
jgi:hypothetical protein